MNLRRLSDAWDKAKDALDVRVIRGSKLKQLKTLSKGGHDLRFIKALAPEAGVEALRILDRSHSQFRQDLFVLAELGFKRNGYFVEFGATDGDHLCNSHLLEKEFGWTGILAEPARVWHAKLKANRAAHIETNCVWSSTGETLQFNEVNSPELSTISRFNSSDEHTEARKRGRSYDVHTISLNDLLAKYDAPAHLDYLSIDTEGSELEILAQLDFDRYRFSVITCEHNGTAARAKIYDLLTSHGYVRKLEAVSECDDWYVSNDI